MVANMAQMMHPEINTVRESTEDLQECTVAVLPFFHIYAMNTIMTVGIQNGAKIVTVPKFEPDMYLKALMTYKVSYLFDVYESLELVLYCHSFNAYIFKKKTICPQTP